MESNAAFPRFQTEKKSQIYLPCTLAMLSQIAKTDDESFKFCDKSVEIVHTMARISKINESALRYEFELCDNFGTFTAVVYKKGDERPSVFRDYFPYEQDWVSVIGTLRKFHDSVSIVMTTIEKITKRTELDSFCTRVVWAHISNNRPSLNSRQQAPLKIQENPETLIMQAIRRANPGGNPKGTNKNQILQYLDSKLGDIQPLLDRMMESGVLSDGTSWGSYVINN